MRIAVTGSHRVGKSTLIDALEERLEGYRAIDEPYLLLEEDGYEFAFPPCLEDFLEQLRRSMQLLDDPFELGVEVLPVHGSTSARVDQVLACLERG